MPSSHRKRLYHLEMPSHTDLERQCRALGKALGGSASKRAPTLLEAEKKLKSLRTLRERLRVHDEQVARDGGGTRNRGCADARAQYAREKAAVVRLLEQAEVAVAAVAAVAATTNDENRQPRALGPPPASKPPAQAPPPPPPSTAAASDADVGLLWVSRDEVGAWAADAVRGCAVRVKNKAEYAVGVVLDVTVTTPLLPGGGAGPAEEPALTLDFGGRRERVPLRFASGSRFTDDEAATYRRRRERAGLAPLARAACAARARALKRRRDPWRSDHFDLATELAARLDELDGPLRRQRAAASVPWAERSQM